MPRPIRGLGTALTALLAAVIVINVAAIGVAVHRKGLFERILADEAFTLQEADLSDNLYALIGVLQSAAFVGVVVVWLIWFYRARSNAQLYGPVLRHDKGWAIAAWFVPFLNLVRPKSITDDIVRASDPEVPLSHRDIFGLPKHPLITIWWAAWVVDNLASQVWFRAAFNEETSAQPGIMVTEVVVTLIDIAAAVAAILVVQLITGSQERKNELVMQRAAPAGPPPQTWVSR
jgi:heme/copper-type cytochrome/quinol oxidase subunit 2